MTFPKLLGFRRTVQLQQRTTLSLEPVLAVLQSDASVQEMVAVLTAAQTPAVAKYASLLFPCRRRFVLLIDCADLILCLVLFCGRNDIRVFPIFVLSLEQMISTEYVAPAENNVWYLILPVYVFTFLTFAALHCNIAMRTVAWHLCAPISQQAHRPSMSRQ